MKGGSTSNDLWMSLEPAAPFALDLFQFVKRSEDSIGERFI